MGGEDKEIEKEEETIGKRRTKSGRGGKYWEGSISLPLLTGRVGYATAFP